MLSLYGITVNVSEGLVAYYTGKPVLPASGYQITDSYTKNGYTLVKDTDFTVSGLNNTDITDDATLIFTGKGNYSGEIQADNRFAIKMLSHLHRPLHPKIIGTMGMCL